MPRISIDRMTQIEAPISKVRQVLTDFSQCSHWSPWICTEPSAEVEVFGNAGQVGHGYRWDGEVVGAGEMRISELTDSQLMMSLTLLKPWKSNANVQFDLLESGEAVTDVVWRMESKLPFFLFYMKSAIEAYVGMDYERGLKMLKSYIETGTVASSTECVGIVDLAEMPYVGVSDECSVDDIAESMRRSMTAVHKLAMEEGLDILGPPGAIYRKSDCKRRRFAFTAFIPLATAVDQVANGEAGTIPMCRALKVVHTGDYQYLGNGWSTLMAHQRHRKLKPLRHAKPFEIYVTDPSATRKDEYRIEIYMPVRPTRS